MPQLDIGSHRTQINSFVVRFAVRYRTTTGRRVPKVARVLKIRSKKRETELSVSGASEGGNDLAAEADLAYGKIVGGNRSNASSVLAEVNEKHEAWRKAMHDQNCTARSSVTSPEVQPQFVSWTIARKEDKPKRVPQSKVQR